MQALAAALTVVVAFALRLVYGPGHLGYDAVWSLEWGRETLAGKTPNLEALLAPTPHPLANAVSVLLAPLGDRAFAVAMALSWLAFAALGVLVFLLGRRLFSVWVGLAAAIVVLTRDLLISETQQAVLDLPFLALVTGALLAEVTRPRERTLVPVLLALAGLLRPEAWLLGLAWLAYAGRGHPRAQVLRWAALVVAAPLVWAAWDLAVTGDPLWSLHGTQGLAEKLERPRNVGTAISALPSYLRDALGDPFVWLGLAGVAAGLIGFYERSLLPATLAAAGMLGFLVLGLADLPLLFRYLLVPAVMLCLFCALLALGWTVLPRGDPARRAWLAAGVVSLVVAAAFVPRQADAIDAVRTTGRDTAAVQDDLHRIAGALDDCGTLFVPDGRPRALLSYWLERSPDSIRLAADWRSRPAPRGVVLLYADAASAQTFALTSPPPPAGRSALPAGGHLVAQNASWLVVSGC